LLTQGTAAAIVLHILRFKFNPDVKAAKIKANFISGSRRATDFELGRCRWRHGAHLPNFSKRNPFAASFCAIFVTPRVSIPPDMAQSLV
jgi:hypothetical protein